MSNEDSKKNTNDENEKRIEAIGQVYKAVKGLSSDGAHSVLSIVNDMVAPGKKMDVHRAHAPNMRDEPEPKGEADVFKDGADPSVDEGDDGISGVAVKWLKRNGLTVDGVSKIFSLGLEDIDLVAQKIPGSGVSQRMKNIYLLKGVASYLGTGAARFTHEQVREACQQYDAWDKANSTAYFKKFSNLVGGSVSSGYTLTARGLSEGATLVKSMIADESK